MWNISVIECTMWNAKWNFVHLNVRYEMTLNVFDMKWLNVWYETTLYVFQVTIWSISETYKTFLLLSVRYGTSCIWMYDKKWLWVCLKVRYETFMKRFKHFRYWVYNMKHRAFECTIRNDFEYIWRYDMKHFRNIWNISVTECTIWNIMHLNVRYEMTECTIWNDWKSWLLWICLWYPWLQRALVRSRKRGKP